MNDVTFLMNSVIYPELEDLILYCENLFIVNNKKVWKIENKRQNTGI